MHFNTVVVEGRGACMCVCGIRDVPRVRFVWSGAVCAHPALHANYPVTTYYTLYFSMKVDTEYVHRRRSTLA